MFVLLKLLHHEGCADNVQAVARRVMLTAQSASSKGNYRWEAELLNHVVLAEPDNEPAPYALADAYEQLR